jgi:hypothetical protein
MKFICKVPNSTADEFLTYIDILDHIKKDNNNKDNDNEQLKVPSYHCSAGPTLDIQQRL